MRPEFIRNDRGFSLVEVLIASSILAVGLVSLAQLLAAEIAANAAAGRTTYAALLAAQKMEELRAEDWESLVGSTGEFVDYVDDTGGNIEGAPVLAAFTRRWSIDRLAADPENTLFVQIIVRTGHEETRMVGVRTRTP